MTNPHLSLQTLEKPCDKGFEASERCFQPLTHPSLTPHSDFFDKGPCLFTGCFKEKTGKNF